MAKREKSASFGAAECARRTGLTVRALRVYERHGLIKPPRSGKGWRLYGPNELARVNVIETLKTFGLTLAQIRSVLTTTPPALTRVLQLQFEALRARKAAAQKGLELVAAALARISSRQRLSIEELCVMRVVDDAITLVEKKAGPSSAPAKKLANRFKQICVDSSLGDPTVYVKWSAAMQDRDRTGDSDARKRTAWMFLASAIDAPG
jgi:DNA-binding transcriptional MerR regulator